VAVSYGGQSDLAAAARRLAAAVAAGEMRPEDITPAALSGALSTAATLAEAGPPDLCIRTSGTQRLSNFMLFEMAYAELAFEPVMWPGFSEDHLVAALRQYARAERRFGGRSGGGGGGGGGGWGAELRQRAAAALGGGG
jgi:undecaprenyl diphosphate synthase